MQHSWHFLIFIHSIICSPFYPDVNNIEFPENSINNEQISLDYSYSLGWFYRGSFHFFVSCSVASIREPQEMEIPQQHQLHTSFPKHPSSTQSHQQQQWTKCSMHGSHKAVRTFEITQSSLQCFYQEAAQQQFTAHHLSVQFAHHMVSFL